jgi:uncharacterized peroxidase-related enzyme
MPRLRQLTADVASPAQRELLVETQRQLGRVPNLYAALANSPAALRGYLSLRDALTRGALRAVERELLALFVAQHNGCSYCVAAHAFRGGRMGLSDEVLSAARNADSEQPHTRAVLQLARSVMDTGGRVPDAKLAEVRAAGVTDEELAEVVAHVALNVLSNSFNHLAQPELDFPPADRPAVPAAGK